MSFGPASDGSPLALLGNGCDPHVCFCVGRLLFGPSFGKSIEMTLAVCPLEAKLRVLVNLERGTGV